MPRTFEGGESPSPQPSPTTGEGVRRLLRTGEGDSPQRAQREENRYGEESPSPQPSPVVGEGVGWSGVLSLLAEYAAEDIGDLADGGVGLNAFEDGGDGVVGAYRDGP